MTKSMSMSLHVWTTRREPSYNNELQFQPPGLSVHFVSDRFIRLLLLELTALLADEVDFLSTLHRALPTIWPYALSELSQRRCL